MTVLLRAKKVGKFFRQRDGRTLPIVDNISLEIGAGEIVCLLGASGSGKTTLLRVLAGAIRPDMGEVKSEIACPGPQFGYLSQDDRLMPWRSSIGNAALGLELSGKNRAEARDGALAALRSVDMEAFADNYPSQLSGGMQQRILLARMLALKPRLLLMDEPMSSLDVLARRELANLIKTYARDNQAAVLAVTHSVEEACFLADRICLVTRAPARLFKEIKISDTNDGGLPRTDALNQVMQDLWSALEAA